MAWPDDYTYRDRIALKETMVDTANTTASILLPISSLSASLQALMNADGSDLRVTMDDGTTRLAHDVITDASGNAATLRIYGEWLFGAKTYIKVWANGTDSAEAAGSTYGQYAAYSSDVKVALTFDRDPSGSAPQILDRTSNANHATSSGMVSGDLVTGKHGQAINFDATDGKLVIADDASVAFGGAYTFRFWVYLDALPTSGNLMSLLCNYDTDANHGGFEIRLYNNSGTQQIDCLHESRTALTVVQTLSTATWLHFALVYDGSSNLSLYINNTLAGTQSGVGTIPANVKNLNIGAFGPATFAGGSEAGRWMDGRMDTLDMQTTAMSSAERTLLYTVESDPASAWDTAVYGEESVNLTITPVDVTITVPDATLGSPLSGTVTLSGSPVNGATVNIYNNTDGTQATEATDASGNWLHIAKLGKNYEVTFEYDSGGTKYTATPHSYIET